jgi:DNA ligase (NAD+)
MTDLFAAPIVAKLEAACAAYYGPGANLMTDAAFDALEQELRGLDPNHPFLSRKGDAGVAGSTWPKARHKQPMTSLNKATNAAEWAEWLARLPAGARFHLSDKLDGGSLSLEYTAGVMEQAITRGKEGVVGDDITPNARRMQGVPKLGPNFNAMVRGEVVCTYDDFEAHFPGESNPRNTANGKMKTKSSPEDCEHLTFVAFSIIPDDGELASKTSEFELLAALGFKTPNTATCHTVAEVEALYAEYIATRRADLNYMIDGLVIQIDATAAREALGDQGRGPLGAIAYKFPSEQAETTLRAIVWQVGKSGRITPVAIFDTVDLAGVRVSRASLHNLSNIHRLWGAAGQQVAAVGDTILVSRRNDVIPYVENVIEADGATGELLPPSACPECSTTLQMDGEYLVCRGDECPAQIAGSMRRWIQKIGVLHFGSNLIETLIEGGLVEDIAGLYSVDPVEAAKLKDSGGRVLGDIAIKGFANLHASKTLPLHVILGSLGIPLVGRSTARTILDGTGTEHVMGAFDLSRVVISLVPGIGDARADSFYEGLRKHEEMLERLLEHVAVQEPATGTLKGQTYCMTGGKPKDLVAALEAAGAVQKSSVGASLSFLVAKDVDSTTGKPAKARKYGVEIITHDEARTRAGI